MRRRRHVFLGVSAVVAVAVLLVAHDVLLPFVLAVVIAYVLTPLVAWAEKRRLPRPVAVLLVYAVVLGSLAGFVRGVAPRIAFEFRNLRGELPALADQARTRWVPAITNEMRELGVTPP
ncbi:MAG: AI-2E family transporter, partial [Polyangiaceae bacterium]